MFGYEQPPINFEKKVKQKKTIFQFMENSKDIQLPYMKNHSRQWNFLGVQINTNMNNLYCFEIPFLVTGTKNFLKSPFAEILTNFERGARAEKT